MGRGIALFVGRRLLLILPLIFAAVTVAFLALRLIPGDPAELMAGPHADRETVEAMRKELRLDEPLVAQYGHYLQSMLAGDFGRSTINGRPVVDELARRLPVTFTLTFGAILFAVVCGPLLGVFAALRRNSAVDYLFSTVAVAGLSVPNFWLGLMLIYLFADRLRWLPSMGVGGISHWVLPCATLGLTTLGLLARMTRATMLEVMGEQFMWTARAKGVPEWLVMTRHGLRNALLALVTIVGTQIGYMLGGAMVTETVFSLPGFGRLIVDAVLSKDYAVVQAGILVTTVLVILVNLVVDLSYLALDPRVRARA